MSDLLELAERCEKAEGPDWELDCAISLALVVPPEGCKAVPSKLSSQAGLIVDRVGRVHGTVDYQPFTVSLDVAMALAPDGWAVIVGAYPDARKPFARLFPPDYANSPLEHQESNDCASHALALCAASLRARASQDNHHD